MSYNINYRLKFEKVNIIYANIQKNYYKKK